MTPLLLLVLWFTVSLPVAVITGRALAVGRPRQGLVSHHVRAAGARAIGPNGRPRTGPRRSPTGSRDQAGIADNGGVLGIAVLVTQAHRGDDV